jgi:dynamin 1-like protein
MKEFDLKQYGDFESLDSKEAKSYLILNLISKFSYAYKDMLDGKYLN